MSEIASNIGKVKEAISRAAAKANRNLDEIKLIAVSKTIDADRIKEANDAGLTIFGENRIQEAKKKKTSCLHQLTGIWLGIFSPIKLNTYLTCSS